MDAQNVGVLNVGLTSVPSYRRATELAEANLRVLEGPVIRAVSCGLARENVRLAQQDLEAAYNQAWQNVFQALARGSQIECLQAFLVTCARRRAIDTYRQRKDGRHTDGPLDAEYPDGRDFTEQIQDRQKVHRLIKRLKTCLNPTQRNAVALCLVHGYTRPEAARLLGMSELAFQKILDRATPKIAIIATQIGTRGCGGEEWARALRSYGLQQMCAEHPDYQRITKHIKSCQCC